MFGKGCRTPIKFNTHPYPKNACANNKKLPTCSFFDIIFTCSICCIKIVCLRRPFSCECIYLLNKRHGLAYSKLFVKKSPRLHCRVNLFLITIACPAVLFIELRELKHLVQEKFTNKTGIVNLIYSSAFLEGLCCI